jgi:glyoxylase-like metal-dependent hydrolase (beta-lactamase superfamily II)
LAAGTIGSAATPQGRTTLQRSVRERLLSRADHEVVLPGHGPPTTIGIERRFNVHLQD